MSGAVVGDAADADDGVEIGDAATDIPDSVDCVRTLSNICRRQSEPQVSPHDNTLVRRNGSLRAPSHVVDAGLRQHEVVPQSRARFGEELMRWHVAHKDVWCERHVPLREERPSQCTTRRPTVEELAGGEVVHLSSFVIRSYFFFPEFLS